MESDLEKRTTETVRDYVVRLDERKNLGLGIAGVIAPFLLVYSLSEVDHYTEKMLDFNSDAFTNTLAAGTMAALAVTGIYIGVREYLSARKQHDTYLNNLVEPGA